MDIPTQEQLLDVSSWKDGDLKVVKKTDESGWRHGVEREEVYHRKSDDSYWSVGYRVSTDGETHGLRENDFTIYQVKPIKVEVIDYVKV